MGRKSVETVALLAVIWAGASGLRMVRMDVPTAPNSGESVELSCIYELENDQLYYIKWYKNDNEFYRYVPQNMPPKMFWSLPGVRVDLAKSDQRSVYLRSVDLNSTGNYICEVFTGPPSFQSVEAERDMNVIDLGSSGLRIVMLYVPTAPNTGESVELLCIYELGNDRLYNIKWYKDGIEFYRYVPEDMPPKMFWSLPGVRVDLSKSDQRTVYLRSVDLNSTGSYRCEVSADAPSFRSVEAEKVMNVIDLVTSTVRPSSTGRPDMAELV